MFSLAEKICLGIVGVEGVAFCLYSNHIKKTANKTLEAIYGTSNIDKIMRMTKEEFDEVWNNR